MIKILYSIFFTLSIVFLILLGMSSMKYLNSKNLNLLNSTINELKNELKLKDENINSLTKELKEFEYLENLKNDLDKINDDRLKLFTLALCYTESNLNYKVTHSGKYDKTTVGICGIKYDIWKSVIKDNDPNSLYSGYLVLSYLLNKNNNSIIKTINRYKGVKTNLEPTKLVIYYYSYLLTLEGE